jgi:hypothetical protein
VCWDIKTVALHASSKAAAATVVAHHGAHTSLRLNNAVQLIRLPMLLRLSGAMQLQVRSVELDRKNVCIQLAPSVNHRTPGHHCTVTSHLL